MTKVRDRARLAVIVGTRPEIIKVASVIHELQRRGIDFTLIHSGQHYHEMLSGIFLRQLGLPHAHYDLGVGSGSQSYQTAKIMLQLEKTLEIAGANLTVVQGDTNTALAGAITSRKIGINVAHIEAGLRSYDPRMPEEYNRKIADHLSQYLFAPTEQAKVTLNREACDGIVYVTGNTIIDACLAYGSMASNSSTILGTLPFKRFALSTTHRAENVENPDVLKGFAELFCKSPIPVVYPLHPRTEARFRSAGLMKKLRASKNVHITSPLGYLDFLMLLMKCEFVLTDSGGIQEEITAPNIRKKAFVLRDTTERPEAVESGYAEVVGTNAIRILARLNRFLEERWAPKEPSPYGDGHAGKRIVDILEHKLNRPKGLYKDQSSRFGRLRSDTDYYRKRRCRQMRPTTYQRTQYRFRPNGG